MQPRNLKTSGAARPPAFTGERFIPHETDPSLALEHYHRYFIASQVVRGKRVLDIACGEGYGAAFLSLTAASVLAIDRDRPTIEQAREKYKSFSKVVFQIATCEDVELPAGGFDVVVCLETIEHLAPRVQEHLMRKMKAALAKNGQLIISTPEVTGYAETRDVPNEYHLHEFNTGEFRSFLLQYYSHVSFLGQRTMDVSVTWDLAQRAPFQVHARKDLFKPVEEGDRFSEPVFLIAVCSDGPRQAAGLEGVNSLYLDLFHPARSQELYQWAKKLQAERDEQSRWALKLDAELASVRTYTSKLQAEFNDRSAWALALSKELQERNATIAGLQKELEDRTAWASKLSEEILVARGRIASLQKEGEDRAAWISKLSGELESARARIVALQDEHKERSAWIEKLSDELEASRTRNTTLQKEFDERTAWAKKLSSDLEAVNDRMSKFQAAYEERGQWAKKLTEDIAAASQRILTLQKELDDRTAWAKKLAAELDDRKKYLQKLQTEFDDRSQWALTLNNELEDARAQLATAGHSVIDLQNRLADSERRLSEAQLFGSMLEKKLNRIVNSPVYKMLRILGIMPRHDL